MRPTEALYDLAEAEGIVVAYRQLRPYYDGLYVREPGARPVILMDRSLLRNERWHRAVFAHELGHHMTCAGEWVYAANSLRQAITLSRVERMASRWAMDYLLPEPEFSQVWRRYQEPQEVANWFMVPEPWVVERLAERRVVATGGATRMLCAIGEDAPW